MSWFKRKSIEQLTPCPRCSQLLPLDAVECDLCGADLSAFPQGRAVPAHDRAGSDAARVR
jgi:hypothetical protein